MFSLIRKRMRGGKGFTLIELLVVIIIIAILAAIAIPTFLNQRQKAQDTNAKSLIRNAMMTVEAAYTDSRDFGDIDVALDAANPDSIDLNANESAITFVTGTDVANTINLDPDAAGAITAEDNTVYYVDDDLQTYALGSISASSHTFAVEVDKDDGGGNTFYIDGAAKDW